MAASPRRALARISAIINDAARAAGASVSIGVTPVAPPASTPTADPAAVLLGDCVAGNTGALARFQLCAGCLNTR